MITYLNIIIIIIIIIVNNNVFTIYLSIYLSIFKH